MTEVKAFRKWIEVFSVRQGTQNKTILVKMEDFFESRIWKRKGP